MSDGINPLVVNIGLSGRHRLGERQTSRAFLSFVLRKKPKLMPCPSVRSIRCITARWRAACAAG